MFNLKFFKDREEILELPKEDFIDELKDARVEYGYADFEYYDTYKKGLVVGRRAKMVNGNNDVIFLNPKAITEDSIINTIVHETLHIVVWKLERIGYSEPIVRRILEEEEFKEL